MNACASRAMLGRRRLAGADRPDRLVGDHEPRRRAARARPPGAAERARLAGLAFLLATRRHTRSHAGPASSASAVRRATRLVGLAEVLASLGMADDCACPRRARATSAPRPRRCTRPRRPSARSAAKSSGRSRPRRPKETNGGQSTASTPSGGLNASQNSRVSARALVHLPVGGEQHCGADLRSGRERRRAAPFVASDLGLG